MNVLVIGATGTLGRLLVPALLDRGARVRAATRHPRPRTLPSGALGVAFDLERPETFRDALGDADRVFWMTRPNDERPDATAAPFLEEMRRAGVRHVVDLSGMGIENLDQLPIRKLEKAIESSGIPFTHVRPNYFFQNFLAGALFDGIVERSEIAVAAGDAAISFVDAQDIAAVAATALVDDSLRGQALTVTGPAAVTHAEIAAAIARATERPVRYRALSDDEARVALRESGLPPERIERRLAFLAVARSGAFAGVSPDVERVLGRAPRSLEAFVREHAARWILGAPDAAVERPR